MAGFDAQRYLRLTAERSVSDGGSIHGPLCHPVLAATAAALVAVDAMTLAGARAVIGDYYPDPASGEDGGHLTGEQAARSPASPPPDIGPLRVVPCGRVLDQPWGRLTIHYAAFTDLATNLRATLEPGQAQGGRLARRDVQRLPQPAPRARCHDHDPGRRRGAARGRSGHRRRPGRTGRAAAQGRGPGRDSP